MVTVAVVAILASVPVLSWIAYLVFLAWVIHTSPSSLPQVVAAVRAFRTATSAMWHALTKIADVIHSNRGL